MEAIVVATIQLHTVVSHGPDQLFCDLDGEIVLMSITRGQYYYLNQVGSYIWTHLATPCRVEAICEALMERYEVERAVCEREVLEFLGALAKDNFLRVVS